MKKWAGSVTCVFTCACGRVRVMPVGSMDDPATLFVPKDWLVTEVKGVRITGVICNHCQTSEQREIVREVQDG